ncbi:hypothetical protein [Edwardsiella piscicida]|uniref:hypothetical protein n=1 Tax=Edwardsiella piscicida TaxID=1263550 RepID=UPI000D510ACE|nr:hypothetical protein [Edwardsiella piscicida]EKS7812715.1 hypothetical protein [Edwardsiella piscicida]UCQ20449.1 hypothetical protein DCE66_13485 [Edwardsiella piscicida]
MKCFTYNLTESQYIDFFSPVRTKYEIIIILMKLIKIMLIEKPVEQPNGSFYMILKINKMSRLFLISPKKHFSINFPFTLIEDTNGMLFKSKYVDYIDNKITSDVISFFNDYKRLSSGDIYDFIQPIDELTAEEPGTWQFIKELLLFEEGYIRYDHDEKHKNGDKHPLHHLDIFYSSNPTFKIGLRDGYKKQELLDLLDIDNDCKYLN